MPPMAVGERVSRELRERALAEDVDQVLKALEREGLLDAFEGYLLARDISLSLCGGLVSIGSPTAKEIRAKLESLGGEAASLLSTLARSSGKGGFPFSGGIPSELVSEADRALDSLISELEGATYLLISEALRLVGPTRESVLRTARSLLDSLVGGTKLGERWERIPDLISALEQLSPPSEGSPPGDVRDYVSLVAEVKAAVSEVEERLSRSKEATERLGLALTELESTIEEIRREISAAEEEGIRAEFMAETIEWALVRAKRLRRRCQPGDVECAEKAAEDAVRLGNRIREMAESGIRQLRELTDLMREVTGLIPEAEAAAEALGRELSSDSLRLIVRDAAAELSGYMGGMVIKDQDEMENFRTRLLEMRDVLRSLISLRRASEEAGGLEEMASRIADGLSSLAIIRAVLAKSEEDPSILTREALPALKEFGEKISEYREAQRDAERLYPYWKRYLLDLARERGGRVSAGELTRIPQRWRPWFLRRVEEEGIASVSEGIVAVTMPQEGPPRASVGAGPTFEREAPAAAKPAGRAPEIIGSAGAEAPPPEAPPPEAPSPRTTSLSPSPTPPRPRSAPAGIRGRMGGRAGMRSSISPAHALIRLALELLSSETGANVPPAQPDAEDLKRRIAAHLI